MLTKLKLWHSREDYIYVNLQAIDLIENAGHFPPCCRIAIASRTYEVAAKENELLDLIQQEKIYNQLFEKAEPL